MSTNKTVETNASVAEFLDGLPSDLRPDETRTIVAMMARLSGEPAKMWGRAIIGFGSYTYQYASGRTGDWMRVGMSPRKAALSVYIIPGYDNYQGILARLGKYKIGKSCLYIKKLADIDLAVLEELILQSVKDMRVKYPD
ncbi:MAG: DUF1801 domain-containing protein [Rhodobacteraceae bacterium]|nr:DUF1801 domain-containing protein [Paracoccaceae bacterium]